MKKYIGATLLILCNIAICQTLVTSKDIVKGTIVLNHTLTSKQCEVTQSAILPILKTEKKANPKSSFTTVITDRTKTQESISITPISVLSDYINVKVCNMSPTTINLKAYAIKFTVIEIY